MKSGEAKLFLGILIVALALVGFSVGPTLLSRNQRPPEIEPPKKSPLTREILVPPGSPMLGDPKAQFTLVEFGDYQCPECGRSDVPMMKLVEKYKARMSYVFHPLQISPNHHNALELSEAAFAAAEQGKFWQMHHALFKNQEHLEGDMESTTEELLKLAGGLRLDQIRFRTALTGESARKKASTEDALAKNPPINLANTPSFFFIAPSGVTKLGRKEDVEKWLADPNHWK